LEKPGKVELLAGEKPGFKEVWIGNPNFENRLGFSKDMYSQLILKNTLARYNSGRKFKPKNCVLSNDSWSILAGYFKIPMPQ
jgi:hypothetical protein